MEQRTCRLPAGADPLPSAIVVPQKVDQLLGQRLEFNVFGTHARHPLVDLAGVMDRRRDDRLRRRTAVADPHFDAVDLPHRRSRKTLVPAEQPMRPAARGVGRRPDFAKAKRGPRRLRIVAVEFHIDHARRRAEQQANVDRRAAVEPRQDFLLVVRRSEVPRLALRMLPRRAAVRTATLPASADAGRRNPVEPNDFPAACGVCRRERGDPVLRSHPVLRVCGEKKAPAPRLHETRGRMTDESFPDYDASCVTSICVATRDSGSV